MFRSPLHIPPELRQVAQGLLPDSPRGAGHTAQEGASSDQPKVDSPNLQEVGDDTTSPDTLVMPVQDRSDLLIDALRRAGALGSGTELTQLIRDPSQPLSCPYHWIVPDATAPDGASPVLSITPQYAEEILQGGPNRRLGLGPEIIQYSRDISTKLLGENITISANGETVTLPLEAKRLIDEVLGSLPYQISPDVGDIHHPLRKRHLTELMVALNDLAKNYETESNDIIELAKKENSSKLRRSALPIQLAYGRDKADEIIKAFWQHAGSELGRGIVSYCLDFCKFNGFQMIEAEKKLDYVLRIAGGLNPDLPNIRNTSYWRASDPSASSVSVTATSNDPITGDPQVNIFLPKAAIESILNATSIESIRYILYEIRNALNPAVCETDDEITIREALLQALNKVEEDPHNPSPSNPYRLDPDFAVKIDPEQPLSQPFLWHARSYAASPDRKYMLSITPKLAEQILGADFTGKTHLLNQIRWHLESKKLLVNCGAHYSITGHNTTRKDMPTALVEVIDLALKTIPRRCSENVNAESLSVKQMLSRLYSELCDIYPSSLPGYKSLEESGSLSPIKRGDHLRMHSFRLQQSLGETLSDSILNIFEDLVKQGRGPLIPFYLDCFEAANGYGMFSDTDRLEYVLDITEAVPAAVRNGSRRLLYTSDSGEIYARWVDSSKRSNDRGYLAIFLPEKAIELLLTATNTGPIAKILEDIRSASEQAFNTDPFSDHQRPESE